MKELQHLFDNNAEWSAHIKEEDPEFFLRLSKQQSPDYLWIGCSDSRVPANEIVGMLPGELFVHRNIANCVVHTDLNCLSVIYYAVKVLKVKHIIVCGHYGCGGVQAAMQNTKHGLVEHWLRNIRDVYNAHEEEVDAITDESLKFRRMCELNVVAQMKHVSQIPAIQEAWLESEPLSIHGWIYDISDGLLNRLEDPITGLEDVEPKYRLNSTS